MEEEEIINNDQQDNSSDDGDDQTDGFVVAMVLSDWFAHFLQKFKSNPFINDKVIKFEQKWNQHGHIPVDPPKVNWKKGMVNLIHH